MRTRLVAPATLLAVLALAGCGGGTSTSSTAEPAQTSSSPDTATSPPATGTSTASTGAPTGLARTKGYGTYEACQGTCTGAVPASLRRPLHLPAEDAGPCPITVHVVGPIGPRQISAGVGFHTVSGSRWLGAQVTWVALGSYTGPVLIRGAKLGGGPLGFGGGVTPYDELQLLDAGRGAPRVVAHGRAWVTYTRIPSGGCYAYQVDGTSFSEVVVFRAVG
ncbi:MAG: hypothetical protein ACXVRP_09565 [Solirubrobacteraceae bacterium]